VRPEDAAEVTPDRESLLSLVLLEEGEHWKVAALQNTRRRVKRLPFEVGSPVRATVEQVRALAGDRTALGL